MMEPTKVYDKSGNFLSFFKVFDLHLPMMPMDCLKSIPSRNLRPDDVLLVTYPKSGTHWAWEIVSMLRRGEAKTIPKPKQTSMLEMITQEDIDAVPEPRVFNTHFQYRLLPASVRNQGNKIVLMHRNPKDVAVSFYNHHSNLDVMYGKYQGTFQDYLPLFMNGTVDWNSWFDYTLEWEEVVNSSPSNPMHVVFYEDMKKDPVREIRRLAEFLGAKTDEDFLQGVARETTFTSMKESKRPFSCDTCGFDVFYRKGEVGDWKNWFTVAQNEEFDRVHQQKMAGSKLKFKFE